ncbi:MAG: M23 family metallopeptidase [Actinomycetota bacterium]|nr:M23 family metallopeptidase [Actinomycetota bacterium]
MKRILTALARNSRAAIPIVAALAVGGLQAATPIAPATAQEAPPSPPPTQNPLEQLLKGLLGGGPTTTVPPAPIAPAPGSIEAQAATTSVGTPPPAPGDGAGTNRSQPQGIPPDIQAQIDSIQRTGGRTTRELMSMLRQLKEVGYTETEAAIMGMGQFPMAGEAAWNDDFLAPRFNPTFHLHQGNDIFAARGIPVRSPDDGTVRFGEDPSGGKAAYVTLADGTFYYMCHLEGFADIPSGSRVKRGQVVGYNGDSGNATGGATHVHFEIHPGGGAAINPKPILDRWLEKAMAAAPALLASYKINQPRALISTGQLRRFDQFESITPGADADTLLWASSVSPPGGALKMAERRAADAAGDHKATPEDWRRAQDVTHAVLAPITPKALEQILSGAPS